MELKEIMNQINNADNLTVDQKGFAQFVFSRRLADYFLEVAADLLKKSLADLIKIAAKNR